MAPRRVAVAAAALTLLLTGCEPLDTAGSGGSGSGSSKSGSSKSGGSKSQRSSQRVEYETTGGSASGRTPAKRSVVVRSGSVARVTSRGSGTVSCRIVLNGRTVAHRSGSGAVTCSARVGR